MPVGNDAGVLLPRRDSMATRLGALAGIARAAWAGSRPELLRQVVAAAQDALDASLVSIAQWEADEARLKVLINHGALAEGEDPEPEAEFYSLENSPNLAALIDDLRGWTADVDTGDPTSPDVQLLVNEGMHCCVGVPIPLEGRVWGELYLTRTADQPCFTDGDIDLALVVAAQIGAALATADHLQRIERLAHTDALTGLANRRAVDELLEAAFGDHLALGTHVSLVVCDLNGLKRINDDQGHDAGDRALVRFGGLLSRVAGRLPGALAARLGGDEFCIVAPNVEADDVIAATEELCRLVLRSPLEGVSCGVASTADDVGSVESWGRLFRLADAAQYRAKRSRSPVPVVAGRSLPPDVAANLSQLVPLTGSDRRMFRGREVSDGSRILRAGLDLLDHSRDESVHSRLASVADLLAQRCDAFSWALSRLPVGSGVLLTEQFAHYRQREVNEDAASLNVATEYDLADYPATAALLVGGVQVIEVSDPDADPNEVAVLQSMGAVSVAIGGCTDRTGDGWLLEVYADAISERLSDVTLSMRTLMSVAALESSAARVLTAP
jgi:diguanylate cyclase (GGDEF)-like protein